MSKNWSNIREEWLRSTSIPEDDAKWALDVLIENEEEIYNIERQ